MPEQSDADAIRKEPLPREFPGVHWYDEKERDAVLRVVEHRSPFRYYGASFLGEADALEREFAAHLKRRYAQAVSSGTNGLASAMAALEVGPGQEVLLPGFLWVATVSAVVRAGAIPVLVEIDDTFNMDPADLEAKLTPRSSVVVVVHMAGAPADMPAITRVAERRGLRVLEDCAQANGAQIRSRRVGTFGDVAVFSFQMNKNITAGEGGMVVTDDDALHRRVNAAHDLGVPWEKGMPADPPDVAMWGHGARMSELTAAVVRAQLPKLDSIVKHMRSSKMRIKQALVDVPGITWRRLIHPEGDSGGFLVFSLASAEAASGFVARANRDHLGAVRLAEYGLHVYSNVRALAEKQSNSPDGFPWSHPANARSNYNYGRGALPRTDDLLDRSVIVPVPSCLSSRDEADMIAIIKRAASET